MANYFIRTCKLKDMIIGNIAIAFLSLLVTIIIKSLSKAQVNAQSSLANLKKDLLSIAYTRNVTDQERAQLEAIANKIEENSSVYTEGVRDFQFQLYVVRLNNIRKSTPNPQTADRLTIDFVNRNYTQLVNCIESIPKVDVMEDERKARRIVAIVNIVALMANNFIRYYKKGVLMEDIILGNLAIVFLNILADFIIRLLGPIHANVQNNLVIFKKELLSIAQSSNVTDQERTRLEAIANKIEDVM